MGSCCQRLFLISFFRVHSHAEFSMFIFYFLFLFPLSGSSFVISVYKDCKKRYLIGKTPSMKCKTGCMQFQLIKKPILFFKCVKMEGVRVQGMLGLLEVLMIGN